MWPVRAKVAVGTIAVGLMVGIGVLVRLQHERLRHPEGRWTLDTASKELLHDRGYGPVTSSINLRPAGAFSGEGLPDWLWAMDPGGMTHSCEGEWKVLEGGRTILLLPAPASGCPYVGISVRHSGFGGERLWRWLGDPDAGVRLVYRRNVDQ